METLAALRGQKHAMYVNRMARMRSLIKVVSRVLTPNQPIVVALLASLFADIEGDMDPGLRSEVDAMYAAMSSDAEDALAAAGILKPKGEN